MSESKKEFEARLKKMNDNKDEIVKWFRGLNLTYDGLLDLLAVFKIQSHQDAEILKRLEIDIIYSDNIHRMIGLIGDPRFSPDEILKMVKKFSDREYADGSYEASRAMIKTIFAIEGQFKLKSKNIARSGGAGRAEKFKALESATIKLYQAGKWASAPLAAQEIAPQIVALSSHGNGDLLPSTTRPLQWIRAHIKSLKSNLS
jgi:hypothetical protein